MIKSYQRRLVKLLAKSGALFFRKGLKLKDGRHTPYFINLGMLCRGSLVLEFGRCFAEWMTEHGLHKQVSVLLGPSYKGSAIVQALAVALYESYNVDLTFDYDRKEIKNYGEATGHENIFVTGALTHSAQVLIIDDVGTSMMTKIDLINKLAVEKQRREIELDIKGVVLVVDREQTQAVYDKEGVVVEGARGDDALISFTAVTGLPVWSLLNIRTILKILLITKIPVLVEDVYRPLDQKILKEVWNYLDIYGREYRKI